MHSTANVSQSLGCVELKKTFNGTVALAGISFELPTQGIVAIIGPNGAGKTTLINILTGFLRPDSGSCQFRGRELTSLRAFEIARLGLARTFQDARVVTEMSVLDNVKLACPRAYPDRLWRAISGWGVRSAEERIQQCALEALDFTGLQTETSKPAGNLSYGQRKLLSLACCFASGASALLLDEPVAGVHPEMADRIAGVMRKSADSGKLIVFIEHDIAMVRELADAVLVLDGGRLVVYGPAAEVLSRSEVAEAYLG